MTTRTRPRPTARAERGSATLLVAGVLVASSAVLAGLGRLGESAVARARADAVADLVALAGVTGGRPGAVEVGRANGAEVVQFDIHGEVTVVAVRRQGVESVAAAAPGPR